MRRVHSHAAAALLNFCEGVEPDAPCLDPIVERLLKLLNPTGNSVKQPKCYVQEQAIMTLAMVDDASEATFGKVNMYTFSLPFVAEKYSRCTALFKHYAVAIERTTQCERARLRKVTGEDHGVRGFNRCVVGR